MFMTHDPARNALGAFPQEVQQALYEVMTTTGVPVEIAILEALSALSICLRDYTLETPSGQLMSTQLYCVGAGPVTCGKGQALRKLLKSVRDMEGRGLISCEDIDGLEAEQQLEFGLLVDATWPGVFEQLQGVDKSAAIVDDDAIDLFASSFFRARGKLNRLFDTADTESMTRRNNRLIAHRPTFGLCLLAQPDTLAEYFQRTNFKDRKTGLAARCFYAYTLSGPSPALDQIPTPALVALQHAQTKLLLLGRVARPGRNRHRLSLSSDALQAWQQIKTHLEGRVRGDLADIPDAVGRATEKCWRVATLLHAIAIALRSTEADLLQKLQEPIGAEWIHAAWRIVEWSFWEFRKVVPLAIKPSTVQVRQHEEIRAAIWHLQSHLCRAQVAFLPITVARDLSGLSGHKFKFVLAHLRSIGAVQEQPGKQPHLLFQPSFWIGSEFAPVGLPRVTT